MDSMSEQMMNMHWLPEMVNYHLPRWEELPEIDLYMDQVLHFIEKYAIFPVDEEGQSITKSMINNYVKLGLMPKPIKKKYSRTHVAYLIAITTLKQVLTISEVQQACIQQIKKCGERESYNLFCQEQENAMKYVIGKMTGQNFLADEIQTEKLTSENRTIKLATLAFASKVMTQKIIQYEALEQSNL